MSAAVAPQHRPSAPNCAPRRPPRQPDWNSFYKNGLPQEVIVIEDSPEPVAKNQAPSRPALPASATDGALSSARKRKADQEESGSVGNGTANGSNIYASTSESNLGRKRRRVEDQHNGTQSSSQSVVAVKRPKYAEYKPPRGPSRRVLNAEIRVVHDVCF